MQPTDRLHALDAVRAYALLLGVVLHSAAAFLEGFPIPMWRDEPSAGATVIYFVIHMFRMSAFFLIAGFFARVLIERRGVKGFLKDRGKRVAIPLFLFWPFVMATLAIGFVLGTLPQGLDAMASLAPPPPAALGDGAAAGAAAPAVSGGGGLNFAHLWFLYYLLLFYALALGLRGLIGAIDPRGARATICDRAVAFLMSGIWGPIIIATPIALLLLQFPRWPEWVGLPAPAGVVPDITGLIGYGIPFGLGWLLNRQTERLLNLRNSWVIYFVAAVSLTIYCIAAIGTTARWFPTLQGTERVLYTFAYTIGLWCWVFALVGAAVRFLSNPSPTTRYLADASYWIYLMHLSTIIFFVSLMRPYDWHWTIKLTIMVFGSMPILLVTYHYLVRFTWIGAILNGRRHPRPVKSPPADTAPAPG
jgi:peptidoglycan/LPS O-acetylase OafA/YrhL